MKKQKKHAITLLEIMVVIFLIGLIGSVIGFNVKGSLEEGKAFKTEQAISQIQDILLLELAEGADPEEVEAAPEDYLRKSGLCKDPAKLIKDGWGERFAIQIEDRQTIHVTSATYAKYLAKKAAAK